MHTDAVLSWGATDRVLTLVPENSSLELARVIAQQRGQYTVVTDGGERPAMLTGKLLYDTTDFATLPAVGDWVLLAGDASLGVIQQVLPRTSLLARKAAGKPPRPQVIAANIDIVFICMAMNANFNLGRLERYLAVVWESRATPVVILTKADLASDLPAQLQQVRAIAPNAEVIPTSAATGGGIDEIRAFIHAGVTIAFVGSSGVGKSTLVNTLAGAEILKVNGLRNDDQGRHTTTHREAIRLPGGGVLIDTPGMRELGIDTADIERTFADIDDLADQCRFGDCTHNAEPGCAVRAAVHAGTIDHRRLESWRKLSNESGYAGKSSRQIADDKLNRIFGGKSGAKTARREFKQREKNRAG